MTKFLVVSAGGTSGRGGRGLNLYWFLAKYHGRKAVRLVTRAALRDARPACETLFVGLPTDLRQDDFAGVRYRRLVVFDYQDLPDVLLDEQTQFLSGLTTTYLKVWVESHWRTAPWKFGVLPIRRQARLPLYLRYLELKALLGARAPDREWDVSFLGAPSGWDTGSQRVAWVREIRAAGSRFTFWGGLATSDEIRRIVAEKGVDARGLFHEGGRVSFARFFNTMRRSKVVLTPMGNARWSYRHYEAIYAGAIPVSCDMRNTTLLIPLPRDIVNVPDGASVIPALEEALSLPQRLPDVRESNVAFLERYLQRGDYSRSKPELMDTFAAQLPA